MEQRFIGASRDWIAKCACHGRACLGIKCPFSISRKSPACQATLLEDDQQWTKT